MHFISLYHLFLGCHLLQVNGDRMRDKEGVTGDQDNNCPLGKRENSLLSLHSSEKAIVISCCHEGGCATLLKQPFYR